MSEQRETVVSASGAKGGSGSSGETPEVGVTRETGLTRETGADRRTSSPSAPGVPLLRVEGLQVSYGARRVVDGVSFEVESGSIVSLIGQSGSGKSTIANAVLRLLAEDETEVSGRVELLGEDILRLRSAEFRRWRGTRIGFVPQDPTSALNPVRRIGSQFEETLRRAGKLPRAEYRRIAVSTLERVGLPDPERVLSLYPHELSGGMQQRVLIGLAIALEPELIVADEPTSALDVTVQRTILDLLEQLRGELGVGILLITHDLALAAQRSDAVVVLNHGQVQERGPAREVLSAPRSAYARQLADDVPALRLDKYRAVKDARDERGAGAGGGAARDGAVAALELRNVEKAFGRGRFRHVALDGVSFVVERGRTHALVGESGSGKSTAVRTALRLEQQDAGSVLLDGEAVTTRKHRELRAIRRQLQLVYQNPFTSLDPEFTVAALVEEPLRLYGIDPDVVGSAAGAGSRGGDGERGSGVGVEDSALQGRGPGRGPARGPGRGRSAALRAEAIRLLEAVGLDARVAAAKPSALSGGQRQRVAIARAIALRPEVLILDEPTSALDVSVQAQILDLLVRLQDELGISYLFVSHDLSVVRQFADTVSVLQQGRVVESGPVREVFERPKDPYTRALLDAVPWAVAR